MITGYVGRVGAGKTYSMIADALVYEGKRPIFSNMNLDWAEQVDTWQDLVNVQCALVLIDEAGVWFQSRDFSKMPAEVMSYFMQSRKQGADIWWTAQSEASVDVHIRRLTATYWRCERWFGNYILSRGIEPETGEQFTFRWRRLRASVYERYDTFAIVGDSQGKGARRGAAGTARAQKRLAELCAVGLVREERVGRVVYRRATEEDIMAGRSILCRRVDGGLERAETVAIVEQLGGFQRASTSNDLALVV